MRGKISKAKLMLVWKFSLLLLGHLFVYILEFWLCKCVMFKNYIFWIFRYTFFIILYPIGVTVSIFCCFYFVNDNIGSTSWNLYKMFYNLTVGHVGFSIAYSHYGPWYWYFHQQWLRYKFIWISSWRCYQVWISNYSSFCIDSTLQYCSVALSTNNWCHSWPFSQRELLPIDCCISSVIAVKISQSCTKPLIYCIIYMLLLGRAVDRVRQPGAHQAVWSLLLETS